MPDSNPSLTPSTSRLAMTWRRLVPQDLRQRVFRARRAALRRWRRGDRPWSRVEPNEAPARPLDRVVLYAILGTWMEADIVADTVANAFTQGVDRVFLLDNESPDDTVKRAIGAGAELAMVYATERFEERHRYNLMNEFVRHQSEISEHEHIWWLWLDADEFPRPADGGTIRDLLERLDGKFRVIGGRVLNHYPTPGERAFVPGDHPLDHQPLTEELSQDLCPARHRKHPLQRWDRSGPRIESDLGFHRARCAVQLVEPEECLVIDHFPFRQEDVSRKRLETLWGKQEEAPARSSRGATASMHMQVRHDSLDAVYAGRWEEVHNFLPDQPERGVHLVPWTELDPPVSTDLRRWSRPVDDS